MRILESGPPFPKRELKPVCPDHKLGVAVESKHLLQRLQVLPRTVEQIVTVAGRPLPGESREANQIRTHLRKQTTR